MGQVTGLLFSLHGRQAQIPSRGKLLPVLSHKILSSLNLDYTAWCNQDFQIKRAGNSW